MVKIKLSKFAKENHLFFLPSSKWKFVFHDGTNEDFGAMWKQAELIYYQMLLCGYEAFHH